MATAITGGVALLLIAVLGYGERCSKDHLIKEEVDRILVDNVVFVLRGDVVVRVGLYEEEERRQE